MKSWIAAAALGACLVAGLGCGRYGAPVRPERPVYDEGPIYDAGQPIENGDTP